MAQNSIILQLADEGLNKLWWDALASQQITTWRVPVNDKGLISAFKFDPHIANYKLLLIDIALCRNEGMSLASFTRWLGQEHPHLQLGCVMNNKTIIRDHENQWAEKNRVLLFREPSRAYWRESLLPDLDRVAQLLTGQGANAALLGQYLRVLGAPDGDPNPIDAAYALRESLNALHIDWAAMGKALRHDAGSLIKDRTYRGKTYRECMVASEIVDWLQNKFGHDRNRICKTGDLLSRFGVLHHVVREQHFRDELLYFRLDDSTSALEKIDLDEVVKSIRSKDADIVESRSYRGKTYASCLVGSEAVDWLKARYQLSVGEAETIGQSLMDLGWLHHVFDEHGFVDFDYFYRFYADQ